MTMSASDTATSLPGAKGLLTNASPALLLTGLSALSALPYFFVALRYNFLVNTGRLMFSSPDASKYRDIGDWLFGRSAAVPSSAALVPLLYPLLVGFIRTLTASPYAIWTLQFVLWLASINLTSLAAYRLTRGKWMLALAFCIVALNVSAIVLSFYALADIAALFLVSTWAYVWSCSPSNWDFRRTLALTLLLSLLVVLKPAFLAPLFIFALFALWCGRAAWKPTVSALAIGSIPVLVQMFVTLGLTGSFGLPTVGQVTLKRFYFAEVYAQAQGVSADSAQAAVQDFGNAQIVQYCLAHPAVAAQVYFGNLAENLLGGPMFADVFAKLFLFGRFTDTLYLALHILFACLVAYLLLARKGIPLHVILPYLLAFGLIVTSGLSAGEGDRLTVAALPLWMTAYFAAAVAAIKPAVRASLAPA